MKKMLIIGICLLFASAALQAQEPDAKFVKAMEKALSGMDTLKTEEQWLAASNKFERIAQKESKEWLPTYYVAFCQIMAFNMSQDPVKQELFAKNAEANIHKADEMSPNNSEIYVLKSMISGLFIRLNPMVNGQKYAPVAGMQLEKAKKLDPSNPRADMQEGITQFFTPPQWGGSKEKGKKLMESAREKYTAFQPASPIHPTWGNKMNEIVLEMVNK